MKLFKPNYYRWHFPAGEIGIRVKEFNTTDCMILDYVTEKDIFVWGQLLDAYQRHAPTWSHEVFIPYLPYGRQDKIHARGEAVSLNVIASFLRPYKLKISLLDPHAPLEWGSHFIFRELPVSFFKGIDTVCFSDKGAHRHGIKAFNYVFSGDKPLNFFTLEKYRNPSTGDITLGFTESINSDWTWTESEAMHVLLNDDICDGGATFIKAATLLKSVGVKKIDLFVTHGIFSRGFDVLRTAGIDHIYTTNSYYRGPSTDYLTVLDLFDTA